MQHAYFQVAETLARGEFSEQNLEAEAVWLPLIDRAGLNALVRLAEQAEQKSTRLCWAIAVTDAVAQRSNDIFLQSLAAWHLARACNQWARPKLAQEALLRVRNGFIALGEPGWLAACDWQSHALPWLARDLAGTIQGLAAALAGLEAAGMDSYAPHCRLTLSFAQMLVGDFDDSLENIDASVTYFIAGGDRLNLARCWQQRASLLRRQGDNIKAIDYLHQALDEFTRLGARVDRAKALSSLAHIYVDTGRFHDAREAFRNIRGTYIHYPETTLYADVLLDSGRLEMFWGNLEASFGFLKEAVQAYEMTGARRMRAIATMYLGLAFSQFDRYQQALHHLESAQRYFQTQNEQNYVAECGLHLAQVWIRLGNLEKADSLLNEAAEYYRKNGRMDLSASTSLKQAEAAFKAGNTTAAERFLRKVLSLVPEVGERAQIALFHRLLGETLLALDRYEKASERLQTAVLQFEAMPMPVEAAAAQVSLGECYTRTDQPGKARDCFEKALALGAEAAPDVVWRAELGLARLAQSTAQPEKTLDSYRRMAASLANVRRDFRQPALAGSYLQQPARAVDEAVVFAAENQVAEDALHFIEESKAQTLAARFDAGRPVASGNLSSLEDLTAEIRWLLERLRSSAPAGCVPPNRQNGCSGSERSGASTMMP